MNRPRSAILAALSALLATTVGCVAQPSLLNPGPEKVQQARAQRFDPYPSNELGPNVADGARPRDYQNPPPEILHVQPRLDPPPPPAQWSQ